MGKAELVSKTTMQETKSVVMTVFIKKIKELDNLLLYIFT